MNTCEHKKATLLTPPNVYTTALWYWCPECGATKMDSTGAFGKPKPGRWVSPSNLRKK
jgi:hypothetical protein